MLVVVSGLPGVETGVAAYEVVAVLAEHQLRLGLTVIADAVDENVAEAVGFLNRGRDSG